MIDYQTVALLTVSALMIVFALGYVATIGAKAGRK